MIHFLRKDSNREAPARPGLLGRLGTALGKTRSAIADGIVRLVGARASIDDDLLEEIEQLRQERRTVRPRATRPGLGNAETMSRRRR